MSEEKRADGWDFSCPPPGCGSMAGAAYGVLAQKAPVLIVFDLDGTIADSRLLARELYKQVFALMGYGQITDELADSFNGPTHDEVCRVMGIGADRRMLYNELIDSVEADLVRTIGCMFPGTGRMLDALAPHAVLAILTNGTQRYCETCISEFALTPYIRLHSGYVPGVTKAQRMEMWARELSARRIICVGDRRTDVENGKAVGALTIAVTYGMGSREELLGADVLCDTPAQVAEECLRVIGEY